MTTFKSFWIRSFISLSLVLAFSNVVVSAEDDAEEEEVEEIIVTGSRIARGDPDGASPVITIDAGDIKATGEISLAEVLRQQTFNSFGSFQPSSGSTAQSQATISLRGAGSARTLVLLDGKRMAGSPSYGGVAANINSIPFGAVERVEILTDGASALYGSDALAGVVNIIMKKDFEGVEFSVYQGSPERAGGDQSAFSMIGGLSTDVGNVVFSFEHDDRDIVYMSDRWWSSPNYRDGYDASNATKAFSHTLGASFYSCNLWSYSGAGIGYQAIPDCVGQSDFLDGGRTFDYGGAGIVLYPYNQIMAEDASSGRDTMFINYNYDINDNHSVNARGIYTRVQSRGRFAPVAGAFGVKCSLWAKCPFTEAQLIADSGGADDYDDISIYYRMRSVGPRLGLNEDTMKDYLIEFKGNIFGGNIGYAAFGHHTHLDYDQIGYNYTLASVASSLAEAGTFEFANMSSTQATQLRHTVMSEDDMKLVHGGFSFDGELPLDLGAGTFQWVAGFEYMDTEYSVQVDPQSESGNVMGSAGNSSVGMRDTRAQYMELRAPLLENLEFNIAHRHDDFNDFGTTDNSKFSLRYQAMDNLVLRASYSESFIAPTLDSLNMSTSFSADTAKDYFECANLATSSCTAQRTTYRLANPDLGPETGEYTNFGVVWNPIEDLSIVVDMYTLKLDNMETLVGASDLLLAEWAGTLANITSKVPAAEVKRKPYKAGSSAVDDGNGTCAYAVPGPCRGALDEIRAPMANFAGIEISGYDLAIRYSHDTDRFGTFSPRLDVTYIDEYQTEDYLSGPMVNKIGRNGVPQYRANLTVNWYKGDWSAYYQIEYIDSMTENSSFDVATLSSSASGSLDSYEIHNFQLTWDAPTNTEITLGIRNLENKDPIIDSDNEWNSALYDLYGRTFFAKLTQRF
jgi:iron complex outermembrane receptor protein